MQQEVKAILTAEDRSYTSTMQKAMGVTESFGSKIKSGIGFGALMSIGQKAMSVVGNAISTNLDGAIKRFDTLQNFPKVMQSLGFSAEDASKGIDKLADGIDHLPTTLDKVASQAQQFVPLTGSIEKATDVTLALNNAIAAGGAPAEAQASAINQWTQAMAKGKPDLMDWRSMVQAAPAQMDQLAKSMLGATANQQDLYEALQSGSISMSDVNDKMIELTNASEGFDIAGKHYDNFAEQAKNASAGIQMSMGNVVAAIQRNMANIIKALDEKIDISGKIQSIIEPLNAIGDVIAKAFTFDTITEGMSYLMDAVSQKAQELLPKGVEMVSNLIMGISQSLPTLINQGKMMALDLAMGIAQALPQLIVSGLNALTNFVNGLSSGNGQVVSKALEIIGTLAMGLIKAMPQILAAGVRLMVALMQGIGSGFAVIPGKVAALAKKIPSAIKSGVGNLAGIGRNLIEGLWGGIKSKFDSVIARVRALAAKLPAAVKKVLGIGSPSRVMNRQVGRWIPAGLAQGITQNARLVTDAMQNLVSIPNSAMGYAMASEYEYGVSARYEVIVPVELNGREIARATASDMQTALNQREMRANRKVGVR